MAVTQTDIQQMIQGLSPSAVNNGNPNTAYNFAPPTQDAQGNWFGGGVGPAASITALNLTPRTPWTPPENTGVPGGNLLDLLPSIPEGGIPMAPGWSPTPAPTPTPQPGGPVTGGGDGPQGQGGKDRPADIIDSIGSGTNGGGQGPGGNGYPGSSPGFDLGGLVQKHGLPFNPSTGKIDAPTVAANPGFFSSKVGNFVGELVDFFIPGNAFDSQTGFDVSNVVTTVLNNMIPIVGPLSSLLNMNLVDMFLEAISDKSWVPEWAKNLIKDHVEDQKKQKNKEGKSGGGGGGNYTLPSTPPWGGNNWFGNIPSSGNNFNTGNVTVGPLQNMGMGWSPSSGGSWGFMPSMGGGGGGRKDSLEEAVIEYQQQ